MITNRPDWINYAYEKEPDIEMLKKALENEQWLITNKETKLKAIRLKYHALTTEPTVIEKTMTPYQLYTSGSPLWTSELTAEEADAILKHTVGTCTLTEEEFNNRYQKALDGELTKKPFHLVMGW